MRLLYALRRRGVVVGTRGAHARARSSSGWRPSRRSGNRRSETADAASPRRRRDAAVARRSRRRIRGRCCATSPSARSKGWACKDTATFLQGEMLKQFGAIAGDGRRRAGARRTIQRRAARGARPARVTDGRRRDGRSPSHHSNSRPLVMRTRSSRFSSPLSARRSAHSKRWSDYSPAERRARARRSRRARSSVRRRRRARRTRSELSRETHVAGTPAQARTRDYVIDADEDVGARDRGARLRRLDAAPDVGARLARVAAAEGARARRAAGRGRPDVGARGSIRR